MNQNAELNTWFAAAWPATARAFPIRLTQKRSTAPIKGLIAKFAITGSDIFINCLSISSRHGHLPSVSPSALTAAFIGLLTDGETDVTIGSSGVVELLEPSKPSDLAPNKVPPRTCGGYLCRFRNFPCWAIVVDG